MEEKAATPQEIAYKKWNNNKKFYDYVNKLREKEFNELTKEAERQGQNYIGLLDLGILSIAQYIEDDKAFEKVLVDFTNILTDSIERLEKDIKVRKRHLWGVIFSVDAARMNLGIKPTDKLTCVPESKAIYCLFRYLWEDYEKYCKKRHIALY